MDQLLNTTNTSLPLSLSNTTIIPANESSKQRYYGGKGEYQQFQQSEEDTMELSTEILIMLFLLMLSIMGGHFLKKIRHKYLQESGLTTLIGAAAGLILKSMSIDAYMTNLSNHFVRLFMILLLPPIIFESGYNMQKKPFFKNVGSIMVFAFFGTFIAIAASTVMFYFAGIIGISPNFTFLESAAFGSLISSTDPVAVLAIFKEMDADITLYSLIFGESIFNDAIAIVMYRTVHEANEGELHTNVFQSIGQFFVVFFGSVLIGAFAALLIAFILKRQSSYQQEQREVAVAQDMSQQRQEHYKKKQNVNTEISMMILCPWVSYLIAEGLELSGIVAIMVNGIFLSYYATPNVSVASRKVLKTGYETVAHSAETLVFLFLGIALFAFNHPYEKMSMWAIPITIVNLSIARFLNVSFVSFCINKTRTTNKVTRKFQFVMWLAGLRGAMAYALALKSSFDFVEMGPLMLVITVIYAFISILLVGSLMNPILNKLDVRRKSKPPVGDISEGQPKVEKKNICNRCKKAFQRFETRYFAPLFIKNPNPEMRNREDTMAMMEESIDIAKADLIMKDENKNSSLQ